MKKWFINTIIGKETLIAKEAVLADPYVRFTDQDGVVIKTFALRNVVSFHSIDKIEAWEYPLPKPKEYCKGCHGDSDRTGAPYGHTCGKTKENLNHDSYTPGTGESAYLG